MKRVLLLVPLALLLMGADKPKTTNTAPAQKVTFQELVHAFLWNEARGDYLYVGKVLEVTGTLARVSKRESTTTFNRYIVEMGSRDSLTVRFVFDLNGKQLADEHLVDLYPSTELTIVGRCQGKRDLEVRFEDCKVVAFKAQQPGWSISESRGETLRHRPTRTSSNPVPSTRAGATPETRPLSLRLPNAQDQAVPWKVEWEYKVVAFEVTQAGNRNVDEQTKLVNSLAAEGWEYVGLLCAGPNPVIMQQGGALLNPCGNVLFKRPKK